MVFTVFIIIITVVIISLVLMDGLRISASSGFMKATLCLQERCFPTKLVCNMHSNTEHNDIIRKYELANDLGYLSR